MVAASLALLAALLVVAFARGGDASAGDRWAGSLRPAGIPPQDFRLRDQDGREVSAARAAGPGRGPHLPLHALPGHVPGDGHDDPRRARRPRPRRAGARRERRPGRRHARVGPALPPAAAAHGRPDALPARHAGPSSSRSGARTASSRRARTSTTPPTCCSSTAAGASASASRSTSSRPRASPTTCAGSSASRPSRRPRRPPPRRRASRARTRSRARARRRARAPGRAPRGTSGRRARAGTALMPPPTAARGRGT